jgi:arginyl-tRNA synthetase
MKAGVKAITDGKSELGECIVQLVRLLREGEPVIMSKRVADFATLREVA